MSSHSFSVPVFPVHLCSAELLCLILVNIVVRVLKECLVLLNTGHCEMEPTVSLR